MRLTGALCGLYLAGPFQNRADLLVAIKAGFWHGCGRLWLVALRAGIHTLKAEITTLNLQPETRNIWTNNFVMVLEQGKRNKG